MKETSKQAYHKIKSDLSRQQQEVIKAFTNLAYWGMPKPATSENLAANCTLDYEAVKKRMGELEKLGLVKDSGKRGKTSSGRSAIIWEVVK